MGNVASSPGGITVATQQTRCGARIDLSMCWECRGRGGAYRPGSLEADRAAEGSYLFSFAPPKLAFQRKKTRPLNQVLASFRYSPGCKSLCIQALIGLRPKFEKRGRGMDWQPNEPG
jgi:hypothetical protein